MKGIDVAKEGFALPSTPTNQPHDVLGEVETLRWIGSRPCLGDTWEVVLYILNHSSVGSSPLYQSPFGITPSHRRWAQSRSPFLSPPTKRFERETASKETQED